MTFDGDDDGDLDPRREDILDLFREAQDFVPMRKQLGQMFGSGQMHVTGSPFVERKPRAVRKARALGLKRAHRAAKPRRQVLLMATLCLLCGLLPQEYGSCRCIDCNQRRARKRNPKRLKPSIQGLSP